MSGLLRTHSDTIPSALVELEAGTDETEGSGHATCLLVDQHHIHIKTRLYRPEVLNLPSLVIAV